MTIISNHHPNLTNDADNDGSNHLGGLPTDHRPTDNGRPIGTTNTNFAHGDFTNGGTTHFNGRPMNHHPTDDGHPVGTTNNANFANGTTRLGENPTNHHPTDDNSPTIGTTNANMIADTNNGTTNIAPNYASLLTLLATNPTDPTIAAAFIEFLQQKNNNNPNIIAPPTPTFTSIITDAIITPNTLTSPGTPSYSSVTTGHHHSPTPTSTNDDEDIEEEDPILS
jgi:hypothetical protein